MDDGRIRHYPPGDAIRKCKRSNAWFSVMGKSAQRSEDVHPRYQDIKSNDINTLTDDDATHIRVIAGDYRGYRGLIDGIDTDPSYLDISLMPNVKKRFPV